jgi:UDP-glucose 4-epimerase
MHWLVTGGAGFIGANLVRHLLATAGQRVRVLDDGRAGAASLRELGIDARAFERVAADVQDAAAVARAARDIDAIVHLAGATGVAGSLADPRADLQANVLGTLNVLEAARTTGARVVFASTTAPLVGPAARADEDSLPAPQVPYGASKLAAEGYCHAYARAFGVPATVLRLTNVYGPGSAHKAGAVSRFLADGLAGRALTVTGDGRQTRDFLHVDDAVRALALAATAPGAPGAPGAVFQIASGRSTAIAELAAGVRALLADRGHAAPPLVFAPPRPAEVATTRADPSKAWQALRWRAEVALPEGLTRLYAHLTRALAASG